MKFSCLFFYDKIFLVLFTFQTSHASEMQVSSNSSSIVHIICQGRMARIV